MLVRSSQSTLLNRSEQNRSQHNWTQHNTNSRVTLIGSPWRCHLCPHPLTKLMTGLYRCSLLYFTPLHSTLLCPTELQYVVFPLVSSMGHNSVECSGVKYSSEQRYKPVMSLIKRWGQRWPHQGDPQIRVVFCSVMLWSVLFWSIQQCWMTGSY